MEDLESCLNQGEDEKFFYMLDAMIRFFFKENPDHLSDFDYASRYNELKWLSKEGLLSGIKL